MEIGKEKIDKMREEEATSMHFHYPRSEDETPNSRRSSTS
jgi:hypothetical protein